jgi:branched-subunit amino acid transport protein
VSTTTLWLTILGAGAVTLALRLSLIALLGRIGMPPFLERALKYVPAAVLTAVVIPLLFYQDGALDVSLGNERLVAGAVAALICWWTRSVPLTLVGGMAVLWTLQAWGVAVS